MSVRRRIIALTVAAAAGACGGEQPPSSEGEAPAVTTPPTALLARLTEEQAEGKVLFESVCWTCHGTGGRGDGPALQSDTAGVPPDFVAGDYAELSTEELLDRFQASLTGEGTDPEHPHMRHVVSVLQPERFRAALSYVPVLAYPEEVQGSAFAGMELYQTHCAGCHGTEGDGEGHAAEALVMAKPADFRSDTLVAARDFAGLFDRIQEGGRTVHGSAMPPWGVALSETQMWDLVAYVSTFQPGVLAPLPGGAE